MGAALTIPYLGELSYLAIPLVMLLSSIGVLPLMEELILLAVGYLAFAHVFHFWIAVLMSVASVVLVDNLHFYLGSHGHKLLKRFSSGNILGRVQRAVDQRGPIAVFIARFVPGMRILMPWVASTSGMRQRKFFVANLLGALIQTPIIVWIGYKLGTQVEKGIVFVHSIDGIVLLLMLIAVVLATILACVFRNDLRKYVRHQFGGANGRV